MNCSLHSWWYKDCGKILPYKDLWISIPFLRQSCPRCRMNSCRYTPNTFLHRYNTDSDDKGSRRSTQSWYIPWTCHRQNHFRGNPRHWNPYQCHPPSRSCWSDGWYRLSSEYRWNTNSLHIKENCRICRHSWYTWNTQERTKVSCHIPRHVHHRSRHRYSQKP